MKRISYQDKLIREELDAHLADCVDDLVAGGMSHETAHAKATAQFGDVTVVAEAVARVDQGPGVLAWLNRLPWRPTSILTTLYVAMLCILSITTYNWFSAIEGTITESVTVLWIYGALIGLGALLTYWLTDFFGWHTLRGIWITVCVTQLLAVSLTIVFDIDKFETNLHALAFSGLVLVIAKLLWSRLPLIGKQVLTYGHGVVVLYSVIYHEPLFKFIAKPGCWFITPDVAELTGALATCHQVQWWDVILYPLYTAAAIGLGYLGWTLVQYWRNAGTQLHRKILLSVSCAGIMITPWFVQDINNEARLDILPYKATIYESYNHILDRKPTADEIDFYAVTRSYEHIDKIEAVLYESNERTIKINELYNTHALPKPDQATIQRYNTNYNSIININQQLETTPSRNNVSSPEASSAPATLTSAQAANAPTEPALLTRIVPAVIEDQLVYPTGHVLLAQDPLQRYTWGTVTIPEEWAETGYYYEIWDANNRPIVNHQAQRLHPGDLPIDISDIDASLYSKIRLVIFVPDAAPAPDYQVPITFGYYHSSNTPLFGMLGLMGMLYIGLLIGTIATRVTLRNVISVAQNIFRPTLQPTSPRTMIVYAWLTVLFSGIFGGILGSYVGGIQISYVLIKLPFLFLGALLFSIVSLVVLAQLLGTQASIKAIIQQALELLAITAMGLASFSMLLVFYIHLPQNHDELLLSSIVFIGASGALATYRLYVWLAHNNVSARLVIAGTWLIIYGFVFLQLGWLLRPWVGVIDNVQNSLPFMRYQSGNVYEELGNVIKRLD